MKPICTNQLLIKFDFNHINQDFTFIRFSSDESRIWNAAYLDNLAEGKYIESLVYESGKVFYVMLKASREDASNFCQMSRLEYENLTCAIIEPLQIEKHQLLQLLVNSLSNAKTERFRFNNLTGKFYFVNPSWFKAKPKGEGSVVWQIPALKFTINKELVLEDEVSTFTSLSHKGLMDFSRTKTRLRDLPTYVIHHSTQSLRRVLPGESYPEEELFVKRQIRNTRSKKPSSMLDFSSWEKFMESKGGAWYWLLNAIEEHLSLYVDLQFVQWVRPKRLVFINQAKELKNERIKEYFSPGKLVVLDELKTIDSENFVQRIRAFLVENYEIKIATTQNPKPGQACLRLIQNKENQINEEHDQYDEAGKLFRKKIPVHHITLEDFIDKLQLPLKSEENKENSQKNDKHRSGSISVLNNILKEIIIKDDILQGKLSIYDWQSKNHQSDQIFGWKNPDEEQIGFLRIIPNGALNFELVDLSDLFSASAFDSYKPFFDREFGGSGFITEGLVQSETGYINLIGKSKIKALPEFLKIGELLSNEHKYFEIPKTELISLLQSFQKNNANKNENLLIKDILEKIEVLNISLVNRKDLLNLKFSKDQKAKKMLNQILWQEKQIILKNYLRGEDIKYDLFSSNLDIVHTKEKDRLHYFVGEKGKGIKDNFGKYANVRTIVPVNGAPVFFENIIDTCNVDFVKHEGLTVLPFPFKYIREYLKMEGLMRKAN